MNDVLKANEANLTKLMKFYWTTKASYLSMEDAINIFSKESDCLFERDALFCFGMSKMTNIIETKDHRKYK